MHEFTGKCRRVPSPLDQLQRGSAATSLGSEPATMLRLSQ
jgi:hypothetical protein